MAWTGAAKVAEPGRGIRLIVAATVLSNWQQRMRFDAEDATREPLTIGAGLTGHVRLGIVPTAVRVQRQHLGAGVSA